MTPALIALVLVSVAIGGLAQLWRGHTAAVWGLVTFALGFVWFLVAGLAGGLAGISVQHDELVVGITYVVMVNGPVAVVMGLIVCVLPKRATAPPAAARTPCPFCAEPVLAAAKVCPHCRKDLPGG